MTTCSGSPIVPKCCLISTSVALYGRLPTNNRTDITLLIASLRLGCRSLLLGARFRLARRRGCVAGLQHDDARREPARAVLVELDDRVMLVDVDNRAGAVLCLHHAIPCRISTHSRPPT